MRKLLPLLVVVLLLGSCKEDNLKIMSLNIRNSSAWNNDGENDWAHRREAVAAMILEEMPDALGMQEMLPDQLAFLDSVLANHYRRIGVGRDDGDTLGENMCIYYNFDRLQLIGWKTYWLSETPDSVSYGWDAACRRTVTLGLFEDTHTGKSFTYMNTHLDHMGQEARRNSVLQLCALADECQGPVIIGGDMNSGIEDSIFLPLTQYDLLSARDIAPVTDTAYTFTGYGNYNLSRIDHFFVRGWEVKEFHTLNGDYGVPYISDHYPITVTLQFPD
ncbi:MAG: endonuclease/exonuclease/phosphatase family protein [Bacteroidales bacterium]|nr:endonuclease/exonuclease/phosphatase family protein [Bacteroidales bacterium]